MSYWIHDVSQRTGIPKNTLIAWERRHGLVMPARTEGGYRLYTDEDVALIFRIKELLNAGYRISAAAQLVRSEPQGAAPTPRVSERELLRQSALSSLLSFNRVSADLAVRALAAVPPQQMLEEVYLPLLQETGERWEAGQISVVQEHFVSAWCREHILALASRLSPGAPDAPEAICATPPGEQHEFGLLAAAFHLAAAGYRVIYLGADVPAAQLLELARTRQPAIVALSAVVDRDPVSLRDCGRRLLAALPPTSTVMIGGRAAEAAAQLSEERLRLGGWAPTG
ncbi:MAG: MerR family transcriptional regulator [Deltaproteobacteria bacterium]|nr:MerR family transcriptional regulator [Deltaproteobacteria bacterium]